MAPAGSPPRLHVGGRRSDGSRVLLVCADWLQLPVIDLVVERQALEGSEHPPLRLGGGPGQFLVAKRVAAGRRPSSLPAQSSAVGEAEFLDIGREPAEPTRLALGEVAAFPHGPSPR